MRGGHPACVGARLICGTELGGWADDNRQENEGKCERLLGNPAGTGEDSYGRARQYCRRCAMLPGVAEPPCDPGYDAECTERAASGACATACRTCGTENRG